MDLFKDTFNFLKTLSFSDYIFFFSVLALMLLIIALIYFIFDNKNDRDIDIKEIPPKTPKSPKKENVKPLADEKDAITDLREITKCLEEAEEENKTVTLNDYETEQEEKAIISYDELIKRKNSYALNYSEEENLEQDLMVKKVDLDHLINENIPVTPDIKVTVISYEKEEAFLTALKTLQKTLN